MSIPTNINKDHLLKAIEKIDKEGIPDYAQSVYYDVLLNGKKYPPKLVVSYANLFANGEVLDRNTFHGGPNKPAFDLLERNGFTIVKKSVMEDKYPDLQKFFNQAKTNELTHKDYQKTYRGLNVEVSFGITIPAFVPWIGFLREGQKVSKGINASLLYYKQIDLVVLAYGVSEDNKSELSWQLDNPKTVTEYFKEKGLGKPRRYGSSYVFKVHDSRNLDLDAVNRDINELIS